MRNISLRIMLWILCLGFVSVANSQTFDKENDNQIGDTAINFSFINENGKSDLYKLLEERNTNVLVVFYSPECEDCQALKKKMAKSKKLNSLIEQKQLTILAVAPEVELSLWQEYKDQMPKNWINSFCPNNPKSGFPLGIMEFSTFSTTFSTAPFFLKKCGAVFVVFT